MIFSSFAFAFFEQKLYALTKGAPETILPLMLPHTVPSNYIAVTRYHMGRGQRVLALAYKTIPIRSSSRTNRSGKKQSESNSKNSNHGRIAEMVATVREEGRASMEKDLCFAGLLVLDCPLKSDSARCITELKASSHKCKMITGDATLTAAEVARQVGIVDTEAKDTYDLREMKRVNHVEPNASEGGNNGNLDDLAFAFVPIHKQAGEYTPKDCIAWIPSNMQLIRDIVDHKSKQSHISLIVSGDVLTRLAVVTVKKWYAEDRAKRGRAPSPLDGKTVLLHPAAQDMLRTICPMVSVFARCAPRQKEAIIVALNASGCFTLMCGDGTNDVGALKQAHVGISIISVPELEAKERKAKESVQAMKSTKKKKAKHARTLERSLQDLAAAQEDLNHVALGDASVASPFTSRTMSIRCCRDILQQGRCTLVTMLQIYKILGVNCLVNALVLSQLHLHGVKQGDRQLTTVGIAIAAMFLFVTKSKPLTTLSQDRPPNTVLCTSALASIAAQFLVHWSCIAVVTSMSLVFLDPDDPSITPDGPFHPNTLNTATFIMTVVATMNTFIVNYRGKPYMQSLRDNKMLWRSYLVCMVLTVMCTLEVLPPLNDLLQLSPLPNELPEGGDTEASVSSLNGILAIVLQLCGFKASLILLMVGDTIVTFGLEREIGRRLESK
jgi:magnesium-transporting ATPase (P-type)